jgi:hypothetical protein
MHEDHHSHHGSTPLTREANHTTQPDYTEHQAEAPAHQGHAAPPAEQSRGGTEDKTNQYYLWHIQILPRVTTIAGFELGSGIYITTVVPEESADFMRETMARVGPDRPCGTGG